MVYPSIKKVAHDAQPDYLAVKVDALVFSTL